MIAKFRQFRYTRPFWAGLITMFAGAVIFLMPIGPLAYYLHAGVAAIAGLIIGLILMGIGFGMWLFPRHRHTLGFLAVVLAIVAFPLSNLGGFIIGTLAGILGGSMAFGWLPTKPGYEFEPGTFETSVTPDAPGTVQTDVNTQPQWTTIGPPAR